MTRGALIFAFNNEHIDYVRMAAWCAKNIRQHLNIPVAIVTDQNNEFVASNFEKVILVQPESGGGRWFQDYGTHVTWYNASRVDAYNLTPWDHTLVLDSDYVVNSDDLKKLFELNSDFLCYKDCKNIADMNQNLLPTFGKFKLPMYWATVMCFKRSNTVAYIFDAMTMIRQNWQHYRDLYGISETNYRNDYALSIALGIVNGHTGTVDAIPWAMMSTMPEHTIDMTAVDLVRYWIIDYQDTQGKSKSTGFSGLDFHAMGKRSLGEIIEREQ